MLLRRLALVMLPLKEPLQVHQDADVLDAPTVGKVEPLGEVGLQVGFDLLLRFLTLQEETGVSGGQRGSAGVSGGRA